MEENRSIKKRRGKVSDRATSAERIHTIGLTDAWNIFITAKVGEGIRQRTQDDYSNTWCYFTDWLLKGDYKAKYVSHITTTICCEYIHYLTTKAPRYKGHKYMSGDYGVGLSTATINMRIRASKVEYGAC